MSRVKAAFSAVVLLLVAGVAEPALGQRSSKTTQIDVVGTDYAFSPLPKRIAAGPTIFTFVNRGTVQHELSIARLKQGETVDDVLRLLKAGGRVREAFERSVGVLISGPGKSPDGKILVNLLAGQTYVVLCTLRNTPDAQPHMLFGMYTTFTPR